MRTLILKKKDIDYKEFVKRSAMESDYDILIKEPCIIKDEDGKVLAIFDVMQMETAPVVNALNKIKYPTTTRSGGLKTTSRIFGFSPRVAMRKDFCSSTSLAQEQPKEHGVVCDFGLDIETYYRTYYPEGFDKHMALTEEKILPEYRIKNKSMFTSGIINKNNPLKYHFDSGNFKDVYSAMVVFKGDGIEGGYLSLPEYGVAFELVNNSLFMFDGQSILHGVTPIKKNKATSYRYSIVYYSMQQIWNCLTVTEELARIKNLKTQREKSRLDPAHMAKLQAQRDKKKNA